MNQEDEAQASLAATSKKRDEAARKTYAFLYRQSGIVPPGGARKAFLACLGPEADSRQSPLVGLAQEYIKALGARKKGKGTRAIIGVRREWLAVAEAAGRVRMALAALPPAARGTVATLVESDYSNGIPSRLSQGERDAVAADLNFRDLVEGLSPESRAEFSLMADFIPGPVVGLPLLDRMASLEAAFKIVVANLTEVATSGAKSDWEDSHTQAPVADLMDGILKLLVTRGLLDRWLGHIARAVHAVASATPPEDLPTSWGKDEMAAARKARATLKRAEMEVSRAFWSEAARYFIRGRRIAGRPFRTVKRKP